MNKDSVVWVILAHRERLFFFCKREGQYFVSTIITAAGPKVVLTAGDAPTGTPAVRCSDAPPNWKMSAQETSSRDCTYESIATRLRPSILVYGGRHQSVAV